MSNLKLRDKLAYGVADRGRGCFMRFFTLGQKVAVALGIFLNGWGLEHFTYLPNADIQSLLALQGIRTMLTLAAIIFALATLSLYRYPIKRR
ncbi:MAG: MFS transporter [Deinococcales bacterium]